MSFLGSVIVLESMPFTVLKFMPDISRRALLTIDDGLGERMAAELIVVFGIERLKLRP